MPYLRGDISAAEIKHWIPSEDRYIASHAPEETAHLVIDSTADMTTKDGNGWFTKRWSPPWGAETSPTSAAGPRAHQ